jgi:YfiH family protein
MQLPAPFEPLGEHISIALPGGRALFTTRRGGTSSGPYASLNLGRWTDDDPSAVAANRALLAETVGVSLDAVLQGRQVHGTRVERRAPTTGPDLADADGQATATPGLAPLVLTADCLPIALIGEGAVAMLHGGWRGLAGGIVAEGVEAVRDIGAIGPLAAAIGPGAGGCCYETGEEVHAAFADRHGEVASNGRLLDLKAIARRELHAAGVEHVHDVGLCTLCADPALFFSHRRDRGVTGRQAGLAWLT